MIERTPEFPSATEVYSDTTAHIGLNVYCFTPIEDATFTTLTGLIGVSTHTYPQGIPIFGNFTAITLATGKIVVYHR